MVFVGNDSKAKVEALMGIRNQFAQLLLKVISDPIAGFPSLVKPRLHGMSRIEDDTQIEMNAARCSGLRSRTHT